MYQYGCCITYCLWYHRVWWSGQSWIHIIWHTVDISGPNLLEELYFGYASSVYSFLGTGSELLQDDYILLCRGLATAFCPRYWSQDLSAQCCISSLLFWFDPFTSFSAPLCYGVSQGVGCTGYGGEDGAQASDIQVRSISAAFFLAWILCSLSLPSRGYVNEGLYPAIWVLGWAVSIGRERLKLFDVTLIGSPRFSTIKEGGKAFCRIYWHLGLDSQVGISRDSGSKTSKTGWGFVDSCKDFWINFMVICKHTSKAGNILHLVYIIRHTSSHVIMKALQDVKKLIWDTKDQQMQYIIHGSAHGISFVHGEQRRSYRRCLFPSEIHSTFQEVLSQSDALSAWIALSWPSVGRREMPLLSLQSERSPFFL